MRPAATWLSVAEHLSGFLLGAWCNSFERHEVALVVYTAVMIHIIPGLRLFLTDVRKRLLGLVGS